MNIFLVIFPIFLVCSVFCDPQLDIPVKIGDQNNVKEKSKAPEVLVIPNSYTGEQKQEEVVVEAKSGSGTSFDFDRDRSERFGPPYDNSDELEERRLTNERGRFNNLNRFPDTQERVRFPQPESNDFNQNIRNQVKN